MADLSSIRQGCPGLDAALGRRLGDGGGFLGTTRRLAAGNNLGEILLWELPDKPRRRRPSPCAGSTGIPTSSRACCRYARTAAG